MTLQEQLEMWENNSSADAAIDIIVDQLNDGVINPIVNPTVKTPALQRIIIIEDDRNAYQAEWIEKTEAAILEEASLPQ